MSSNSETGAARPAGRPAVLQRNNLQLSRPFGMTVLWSVVILALLVGVAELLARTPAVQQRLPAPSIGSSHRVFELQVAQLDAYVAVNGDVDCVFLGSSQGYRGFDPVAFADGYAGATGAPLTCYNFSVGGLTPMTAAVIADVIVRRYAPPLLIYGIEGVALDSDTEFNNGWEAIAPNPWVRFMRGEANLDGWLRDKSAAYRYYLVYRNWMKIGFAQTLADDLQRELDTTPLGQGPLDEVGANIGRIPTEQERPNAYRVLNALDVGADNLDGLDQILALNSADTQVLLVEMPVHPNFIAVAPSPDAFEAMLRFIGDRAAAQGVRYITSSYLNFLPDDLWSDHNHLNADGAPIFSEWLGRQVGDLVAAGTLREPQR